MGKDVRAVFYVFSIAFRLVDDGDHSEVPKEDKIYSNISLVCLYGLVICCAAGAVGNIISIVIFTHPQMRKRSINMLLCGLSITDLVIVLFGCIFFGVERILSYYDGFSFIRWKPTLLLCCYYVGMVAQSCSVWIFVLITIERYYAVCHPLKTRPKAVNRTVTSLIIILILATLYNLTRLWEYIVYTDDYNESTLLPFLRLNRLYMVLYFSAMYLVVQFLAPFGILAILGSLIVSSLYRSTRISREIRGHRIADTSVTYMMLTITLIFAICNVPPFLLNLAEAINPTFFETVYNDTDLNEGGDLTIIGSDATYMLLDITNFLVVVNASITFCFYCCFSQRYRSLLRALIACRWRRRFLSVDFAGRDPTGTATRTPMVISASSRLYRRRFSASSYLLGPEAPNSAGLDRRSTGLLRTPMYAHQRSGSFMRFRDGGDGKDISQTETADGSCGRDSRGQATARMDTLDTTISLTEL